jgi:hypothetical protein
VSGLVLVYEVRSAGDILVLGNADAGFSDPVPDPTPIATYGPCNVSTVGLGDLPDVSLDGGGIEVTVGQNAPIVLTPVPAWDGVDYVSSLPESNVEVMSPGQTVQVTAAGGPDVAAFSGGATVPADPVITNDYFDFGHTEPKDSDLQLDWTGGTGQGTVLVSVIPIDISTQEPVPGAASVLCTVPDTGSFVVASEALSHLPDGSFLGQTVIVTVARSSTTEVVVGPATVTISISAAYAGATTLN